MGSKIIEYCLKKLYLYIIGIMYEEEILNIINGNNSGASSTIRLLGHSNNSIRKFGHSNNSI